MDPKYFGLNQTIGQLIKSPADQGRIVAIAAAIATSAHAHLPSSPVENPMSYYSEQVFASVSERLSAVNESIIFSAKSALDYSFQFWKLRYYAAFPADVSHDLLYRMKDLLASSVGRNMDVNLIWAGGLVVISDEMNTFMNKYKVEISLIAADLIFLLRPVNQGNDEECVRG